MQSGAYEIGVLDYSVWELERKAGKVDESKVSVIWESPPFLDYQWTARGDIDAIYGAGFTGKLTATLLAIDSKSILEQFGRSKFIAAKNEDYAPIEVVARASGLLN